MIKFHRIRRYRNILKETCFLSKKRMKLLSFNNRRNLMEMCVTEEIGRIYFFFACVGFDYDADSFYSYK